MIGLWENRIYSSIRLNALRPGYNCNMHGCILRTLLVNKGALTAIFMTLHLNCSSLEYHNSVQFSWANREVRCSRSINIQIWSIHLHVHYILRLGWLEKFPFEMWRYRLSYVMAMGHFRIIDVFYENQRKYWHLFRTYDRILISYSV